MLMINGSMTLDRESTAIGLTSCGLQVGAGNETNTAPGERVASDFGCCCGLVLGSPGISDLPKDQR